MAFRRWAKLYHPDANPDPKAVTRFQVLNEAHRVLSDPKQRATYDAMLLAMASRRQRLGPADAVDQAILQQYARPYTPPANRKRRSYRKDLFRTLGVVAAVVFVMQLLVLAASRIYVQPAPRLDLSYRGLDRLPPSILGSWEIRRLNLSHNEFRVLSPEIQTLAMLELINLAGNQLEAVPAEVFRLTELSGLNLSNNRLASLPKAIGYAKGLRMLDLHSNRLEGLPEEFFLLDHLVRVDLRGNPIPPDSLARIRARMPKVQVLGGPVEQ